MNRREMSNSDSSSTNGTSSSSSAPPPLTNQTPPSPDSTSPPPSADSKSSPPTPDSKSTPPTSDSKSSPPSPPPPSNSPPSSSNKSPPPPSNPPPSPPPSDEASSPPPPSKSTSPPPSSSPNQPPPSPSSSNADPPPPPQSLPPPNSPSSNNAPPPSPPVNVLPPPTGIPATPPPPIPSTPVLSPPGQVIVSPDTPGGSSSSPPLPGSPPNPSTPTLPRNPSSTSSDTTPSNSAHVTPPSKHTPSSSSTPPSPRGSSDSSNSSGSGAFVGLTLAGMVVALVAIFFVISRRKKRRLDNLDYRPPPSFSVKSDGYYYRQTNPTGSSSSSGAYYASQPQLSSAASGNIYGSNRGHGYHSGYSGPPDPGGSKSWFSYEELNDITNGFARENILGEGGFGCVYKGFLPDGRQVAVKQLKAGSGQGEREFRAEVEIISRVHHRHLVSLVGYCVAEHHRLLVYEFVPNNTLEHHLHGRGLPFMEWAKRVKIALGSARGLAYLHEDCHPRIIHRDIKSANILLDDAFEAQVADFGLAKLSNDTHTHVSTRVMGTFGYMAPEYASSGKLTDRSDVFSFGVVLLELITGRKPVDPTQPLGDESLVEWARPLLVRALESGDCEELVDGRLENNYVKSDMFRMIEAAAACVRHSAPKRPRMAQVVRALDNEGEMSDLTNGVKFGQSTVFDSGQYSADIQRFRRMAFGSEEHIPEYGPSGEHERRSSAYSGEFHSRESPQRPPLNR